MKIKEWPLFERPRERFARLGGASLSTAELLAILIRTGLKGVSALTLAQKLLARFRGLDGLSKATLAEIASIKGIGLSKAISIKAALELAKRSAKENGEKQIVLNSFEAVKENYMEEMRYKDREVFMALHLNTKKQLIHEEVISVGTLNSSLVHPREVFRQAIKNGTDSIILLHNHPSGDPTPSPEDVAVTKLLQKAGGLLQIAVVDHIVFGKYDAKSVLDL